ncbi:MAG: NAD(P)/FAD-dependent oxidoreductase [Thermoprotei archaeon]
MHRFNGVNKLYDVSIVGAGPAGLFAAYEIVQNAPDTKIVIIDKGFKISQRKCPLSIVGKCVCPVCHINHGVGGAGLFSSGIINLRPDIGGDLQDLVSSRDLANQLITYVDKIFVKFGASEDRVYEPSGQRFADYQRATAEVGAHLTPIKQRHIGTDGSIAVIDNFTTYLEKAGVQFSLGTAVNSVEKKGDLYELKTNKGDIQSRTTILAPGRVGAEWFRDQARRLHVELLPNPLDVGIRVEVPKYVMDPLTDLYMDPKVIMYTKSHDDKVRTFCVNPDGFVVVEKYDDGTIGVNGETYTDRKSGNTNFALLASIKLTDPMEDTIDYGKSISKLATKLGGGKPIIQRLGDLEDGRRSTWERIARNTIEPTMKSATPGDLSMALPYRVMEDLLEFIKKMDSVLPGLGSKYTLLYAPEIKYYSMKAMVNQFMETSSKGVFAAGDGAGLSRGINVAAATGILSSWGALSRLGIDVKNEMFFHAEKAAAKRLA